MNIPGQPSFIQPTPSRRQGMQMGAVAVLGFLMESFSRIGAMGAPMRAFAHDGFIGAPAGKPQYPALLSSYKARPSWNVAGVDYHVGVPAGAVLKDWRTLASPNLNINKAGGVVTVSGDYDFENIDFSLGTGAIINNVAAANTVTFNNCNFQLQRGHQNLGNVYLINGGPYTRSTIVITNCNIDGTNLGAVPSFISAPHNITLQYNYFSHSKGQILQWTSKLGGAILYRYNFIDDTDAPCGAHMNYHQLSGDGKIAPDVSTNVSYNTTYQHSLGGAEGFQFYFNGFGRLLGPVLENNTMISVPQTPAKKCPPATYGPQTVSYFIRSSGTVVGTGSNKNNHFDVSGAYGAYADHMPGWTSAGNINMTTGATITPA